MNRRKLLDPGFEHAGVTNKSKNAGDFMLRLFFRLSGHELFSGDYVIPKRAAHTIQRRVWSKSSDLLVHGFETETANPIPLEKPCKKISFSIKPLNIPISMCFSHS